MDTFDKEHDFFTILNGRLYNPARDREQPINESTVIDFEKMNKTLWFIIKNKMIKSFSTNVCNSLFKEDCDGYLTNFSISNIDKKINLWWEQVVAVEIIPQSINKLKNNPLFNIGFMVDNILTNMVKDNLTPSYLNSVPLRLVEEDGFEIKSSNKNWLTATEQEKEEIIAVEKEVIKFETKEEKDDSKYVDEKVTKVEGKNGEKEVTYNVVREKGKEVSREVASEKVITEATAKVVVVGTKQRPAAQQQEVAAQQSYAAPAQSYSAPGGSVVLSNGNTAGADGAAAAQEMARRTGVPASTWEHIIARESNGQVGARNASGASGLFQTMPGWGSTATVQDQIDSATRAYQAQGLSAWGM